MDRVKQAIRTLKAADAEVSYAAIQDGVIWGVGSTIDEAREDAKSWMDSNAEPGTSDELAEAGLRYVEITPEERKHIEDHGYASHDPVQHKILERNPVYSDEHGPHRNGDHVSSRSASTRTAGDEGWGKDPDLGFSIGFAIRPDTDDAGKDIDISDEELQSSLKQLAEMFGVKIQQNSWDGDLLDCEFAQWVKDIHKVAEVIAAHDGTINDGVIYLDGCEASNFYAVKGHWGTAIPYEDWDDWYEEWDQGEAPPSKTGKVARRKTAKDGFGDNADLGFSVAFSFRVDMEDNGEYVDFGEAELQEWTRVAREMFGVPIDVEQLDEGFIDCGFGHWVDDIREVGEIIAKHDHTRSEGTIPLDGCEMTDFRAVKGHWGTGKPIPYEDWDDWYEEWGV